MTMRASNGERGTHETLGVVSLMLQVEHQAQLDALLVGQPNVFHETSLDGARRRLSVLVTATLLLHVPAEEDDDLIVALRALRVEFPHAAVLALFLDAVSDPSMLARMAEHGVSEVVVVKARFDRAVLTMAFSRCVRRSLARRIWERAALSLADDLETLLRRAILVADQSVSVSEFARAAGLPERSLRHWCSQQGYPSPQWLLGWARVLTASYLMEERGRSVDSIAHALGYASPSALRNQVRRYTGRTPSGLDPISWTPDSP